MTAPVADRIATRTVGWAAGMRVAGVAATMAHLFYLGGIGGRRLTVLITSIGAPFGARAHRMIEGELASVDPGSRHPDRVTSPAGSLEASPR